MRRDAYRRVNMQTLTRSLALSAVFTFFRQRRAQIGLKSANTRSSSREVPIRRMERITAYGIQGTNTLTLSMRLAANRSTRD